jgi:hypothetical protein
MRDKRGQHYPARSASSDGRDDAPWRGRTIAAVAFFFSVLVIQVGIPLIQLWAPRPARFGWQMFTARPAPTRYTLVFHDGTRKPVDLEPYVAKSRGEMDVETALPPHLCRVVPDLASVLVLPPGARQPRVHPCR